MSSDPDAGEPPSTTSDGHASGVSRKVYDAFGRIRREHINGNTIYFDGPKHYERVMELRSAKGEVLYFEGPRDREHLVQKVYPEGRMAFFLGERGCERLVRTVSKNMVNYHNGERKRERIVRMVQFDHQVLLFDGERGDEKLMRALTRNGDVQIYVGSHYTRGWADAPVRVEKKDGTSRMFWLGNETAPRRSQLPRSWDERRALERMRTFCIYRKHTPRVYARFDQVYLRRCFKRFARGVFANRRQVLSAGRIRYHGELGEKRFLLESDGSVVYYDGGPDAEVAVRGEAYGHGKVYMQSLFSRLGCVTVEKKKYVPGRLNERLAFRLWYCSIPGSYGKYLCLRRCWFRLRNGIAVQKKAEFLLNLSRARRIFADRRRLRLFYSDWRVWLAARHARLLLNETRAVAELPQGRASNRTRKQRRKKHRQSAPADDAPVDAESAKSAKSAESANPGDAPPTGASTFAKRAVEGDHDGEGGEGGEDGEECVLCMDAPREYALVPCGHRCICATCIVRHRTQLTACPLCKASVESVLRIFG